MATWVSVDENIFLSTFTEAIANGVVRGLYDVFGHVHFIPIPEPIKGISRAKVAVFRVQAPPWGNGIFEVNRTRIGVCVRHMAHKGGHVEIFRPTILRNPKPRTDAFAVGTCWQVRHVDRLPLPLGAVMYDRKNHEILR